MHRLFEFFIAGEIPAGARQAFVRVMFRGLVGVHILWACGWLSWIGLSGFAKAGDVIVTKGEVSQMRTELTAKIETVNAAVVRSQKIQQRTAMELELRRLEQEIFNVEARVKELSAAGIRADRIYDERLHELKQDRARIESQLDVFMRTNPDLVGVAY